ncbi:hypothetical protein [Paucibacter soli]|uniref:hypothetical protein n=1 Tax=Paucibacter soli TaxID=3133433 RepID=UPI0030B1692B
MESPVVSGRPGTKTTAWRNLDKPGAKANFHVVVHLRGQTEHDLLALTPERIKALGEQFLEIHRKITDPEK